VAGQRNRIFEPYQTSTMFAGACTAGTNASIWRAARLPRLAYDPPMPLKQVDGSDNGPTAHMYGQSVGVQCGMCSRRALAPLDRIGTLDGNMRNLQCMQP
jgi:hypothetical protein